MKAFCKPKIKVGTEWVLKMQSCENAMNAVGGISRAIYNYLFKWLIIKCNETLIDPTMKKVNFCAVLDIAGFEIFEFNGPWWILEWICKLASSCLKSQWEFGLSLKKKLSSQKPLINHLKINLKLNIWENHHHLPNQTKMPPTSALTFPSSIMLAESPTMSLLGWKRIKILSMIL